MTELLEDLEMLKERILSERCVQELPGDSPMVTTARKLLLAGLLGRLPTNGHTASPETGLPVPLSLSPVSPVETAPEPSPVSGDATPGGRPTGETQEEVSQEPPPMPPLGDPNTCDDCGAYKPKGVCDVCHPVIAPPEAEPEVVLIPVDRERQPGSSGAIFEARVYVLTCLDKSQPINLKAVCNITGWDNITASKFIRDTQDEFRQTQRQSPKTGRPLKVNEAGVANLLRAIANAAVEGDEEPEDVEEPEPTTPEAETGPKPVWWSEETKRVCAGCGSVIEPRRYESRGQGMWETQTMYARRKSCGWDCRKAANAKKKEAAGDRAR